MAVSKRLRFEIFRRDGFKCRYCGLLAGETELTIDHVVPRTLGGSDDPTNLVTACKDCNAGKTSSNPDAPLVAEIDLKASQWAQAMEIAIARRQEELAEERDRVAAFDEAWNCWQAGDTPAPRDQGWRSSVSRMLAAGLDDAFLADAVDIAMNSKARNGEKWRYFCGVCWRELDKIQGIAAEVAGVAVPQQTSSGRRSHDRDAAPLGRGPAMDDMQMFDAFLAAVVEALGGSQEVVDYASRALWDAMPAANEVWHKNKDNPRAADLADDEDDNTANDLAVHELRHFISPSMVEIKRWRSEGGKPTLDLWSSALERWHAIDADAMTYLVSAASLGRYVGCDFNTVFSNVVTFGDDVRGNFMQACEAQLFESREADELLLKASMKSAGLGQDNWVVLSSVVAADGS